MWKEKDFLTTGGTIIVTWENIIFKDLKVAKHVYHSEILHKKLLFFFSFTFHEYNQYPVNSAVTKDWFVSGYHTQNLRYQRQFWASDIAITIKYYGLYVRLTCECLWFTAWILEMKSEAPFSYGFISLSSKG